MDEGTKEESMNERIQELHNQARDFYLQDDYMDLPMKELHRLVEAKFAELIVEECINVCKSRVGNSDYNTGRLHCVSDIRERFEFGMTTEEKKALIKELLGVNNETN
jgi:hypothetical protein